MKRHLAYLLLIALLYGCTGNTSKPLLKKSPYDSDFRYYSERLDSKNRKAKHIKRMESAYQSAQKTDMLAADSMLNLENPDRWLYINAYYRRMQDRQQKVQTLMPLESKDGYKPDFLIINNLKERESASRKASAAYLYQKSEDLLASGKRPDARAAFSTLVNLKDNYYPYWENMIGLIDSAARVGVEHVLVESDMRFYPGSHDSKWQKFYTDPDARDDFDIVIRSNKLSVFVGPDFERTSSYTESKQIEVGVEEKKDSTGHVIERTVIYETVSATVTEVEYSKTADATVSVEVIDGTTGALIYTDQLSAQSHFCEKSVSVSGDRRALSASPTETGFSVFVPSYFAMQDKVMDELSSNFAWFIESRLWTEE